MPSAFQPTLKPGVGFFVPRGDKAREKLPPGKKLKSCYAQKGISGLPQK